MKDYRHIGRYTPDQWEDNTEWLARRMDFIWDFRQFYTEEYLRNGMCEELQNDFYGMNDDEVGSLAAKYNNYDESFYKSWESMSLSKLVDKYRELERLRKTDKNEFMKKNNCYLYCYITEQRWESISEYMTNYQG